MIISNRSFPALADVFVNFHNIVNVGDLALSNENLTPRTIFSIVNSLFRINFIPSSLIKCNGFFSLTNSWNSLLCLLNSQKSHEAKSGEYSGC